jgi:hypothetical protein
MDEPYAHRHAQLLILPRHRHATAIWLMQMVTFKAAGQ